MQLTRSLNGHVKWKLLGFGVQLLVTVLLSRLLEAADSGRFFYFISWLTFFILIGSGGFDSAITYFLASGKISKPKLLSILLLWLTGIIIVFSFTGYFLQDGLVFLRDFPDNGFLYGLLYITGFLFIHFFTAFFYGEHQFIFPSKFLFFTNLFYAFFLLYCTLLYSSPAPRTLIVKSYIWMITGQGVLMGIICLFKAKFFLSAFRLSKQDFTQILTYGFWALLANLLFFATTRIDYWFLKMTEQPADDLGNYIQVSRIAQILQVLPAMLAAYFFPMTASKGDQMIPHLTLLSRCLVFFNCLIILPFALFGQHIFPFVFGHSYDQMHILFLLYIPGMLALSVLSIMSTYIAGINQVKINMFISLAGLIIVCAGNWYLIPLYGTQAAAFVSSMAYTSCCLMAVFIFLKKSGLSMAEVLIIQIKDINLVKNTLSAVFLNRYKS